MFPLRRALRDLLTPSITVALAATEATFSAGTKRDVVITVTRGGEVCNQLPISPLKRGDKMKGLVE